MTPPNLKPTSKSVASGAAGSTSNGSQESKSRLRKACDSCSIRKVKCDEEGPPCQACAVLEIPCTYERPSRRRGPPNKHAEAIKKRKPSSPSTDAAMSPPLSATSTPSSTIGAQHPTLSAESICPWPLVTLLVDDYFTYIHPLVPFPHEPTFRASLQNRDDVRDPKVLALLAAMIGALVASFPRKARQHLKALRNEGLFPNSISLLERCQIVAAEARGPGYLDKDPILFDALTSYLLGLAGGYTFRMRQNKLYFGECLSILRSLGFHRPGRSPESMGAPGDGTEAAEDLIGREIGRRAFWVVFVGARSIQQLGGTITELFIPPETSAAPYPPLPLEVDDQYIFQDRILSQPAGTLSELVGFNANVKVYRSYEALSVIDMTYGINSRMGWDWQRLLIKKALLTCKHALDGAPPELKLTTGPGTTNFGPTSYTATGSEEFSQVSSPQSSGFETSAPDDFYKNRLQKQYEIQKANLYISQLGSRSHIVEKYWTLCEYNQQQPSWISPSYTVSKAVSYQPSPMESFDRSTAPSESPTAPAADHTATYQLTSPTQSRPKELGRDEMAEERENIIRDLLMVLSSISQCNMEPNGGSLMFKIRMIASTLLDVPPTRKGTLALKVDEYLARFLDILVKLERVTPSPNRNALTMPVDSAAAAADEEAELRHWADLGKYQAQFIKSGGFLG